MKFNIDWDTVEGIGTEYIKQTYVILLEIIQGHDPDNKKHQAELMKKVECFETVLKYILPEGESHAFIARQRQKHLSQIDLFN
jgi:hypothetical protein